MPSCSPDGTRPRPFPLSETKRSVSPPCPSPTRSSCPFEPFEPFEWFARSSFPFEPFAPFAGLFDWFKGLFEWLKGLAPSREPPERLRSSTASLPPEFPPAGYRLRASSDGYRLRAAASSGLLPRDEAVIDEVMRLSR